MRGSSQLSSGSSQLSSARALLCMSTLKESRSPVSGLWEDRHRDYLHEGLEMLLLFRDEFALWATSNVWSLSRFW